MAVKVRRQQGAEEQIGDVKFSVLTLAQFQALHGSTWVQMTGQSIAGSDLAVEFGITTLDDARGRVLIGAGQGTGLTNRANRATLGAETHQLSAAEMPSHGHVNNFGDGVSGGTANHAYIPNIPIGWSANGNPGTYGSNMIQPTGGDGVHNNMQPSLALNCFIKINR